MKQLTLNKCLNKLDTIIFQDVGDCDDVKEILDYVRIYINNSTEEHIKKFIKDRLWLCWNLKII